MCWACRMSSNSSVEIITLNVGGTIYTTARSTLLQFGDTMLGAMFSGRHHTLSKDKNGNLFIDRDGPMFRHVLNFLRTGRLTLPGDFKDHDMLEAEADFYGIDQLVDAVRASRVPIVTESPKKTDFKREPGTLLEIYQVRTGFKFKRLVIKLGAEKSHYFATKIQKIGISGVLVKTDYSTNSNNVVALLSCVVCNCGRCWPRSGSLNTV